MKKATLQFIFIFILFTLVFTVAKPLFLLVHEGLIGDVSLSDVFDVIVNGLTMDMSVAGYLTILPGVLIILMLATQQNWLKMAMKIYLAFASFIVSAVLWLDVILYGYWGSKLDSVPFFYFFSSPSAALASVYWWQIFLIIFIILGTASVIWLAFIKIIDRVSISKGNWKDVSVLIILTALLFVPIRGSITVSTMNPSHAYYSNVMGLNHAAVNPFFNLLYSVTHTQGYADKYRFYSDQQAAENFETLNAVDTNNAEYGQLVKCNRPDIVFVILESFSSHLMPSLGGENIAVGLDSIAKSGLLYTNIYASGIRTDRALAAILSAVPAQPANSVLKYVDKIEKLPSLPKVLLTHGYDLSYFYGGDINFTNMQAYLMSMGFSHTVCDKDFSVVEAASKWGAPDHLVFEKAEKWLSKSSAKPRFTVIQTSSSHEPFDVPYQNNRFEKGSPQNAFAYTDSCVTDFVNNIRNGKNWDNTLVVLVPDHYGCWPKKMNSVLQRHRVPLIMTGGALDKLGVNNSVGSQTDITATLLAALKISYSEFPFSHDLNSAKHPHYAFMSEPGTIALVYENGYIALNCDADIVEECNVKPGCKNNALQMVKSYLQVLYTYLTNL